MSRPRTVPVIPLLALALAFAFAAASCGSGGSGGAPPPVVVDTLSDADPPPPGRTTLRAALDNLPSGGSILFSPDLDGGTVDLLRVGAEHSLLRGEVFTMGSAGWTFQGFQVRDYGRSALYAAKNVTIDASGLPSGITLRWGGGDGDRARVLAVLGNLTLRNVTVRDGFASAAPLDGGSQPFTLGRGGGIAVWGTATLANCTLAGNRAEGDVTASRDRGAFGGGIYANRVRLEGCVVSGNSASGYGAAGGGVYSVGGVDGKSPGSRLSRCAVTGNRVTAQHAYGGGVYSDGGGPGNLVPLELSNCTVARNRVEDHPGIAESRMAQYYYRGGGVYMSNGYLWASSCTIAENEVEGVPAVFGGKPNMGGGGAAATIGNAHVVEDMRFRHSIVAGNRVNGAADDVYTGSLLHFYSEGYNLVGKIDFGQVLVPAPPWQGLSRRHWPKAGDRDGVEAPDVLDLAGAALHPTILSAGTDAGGAALLWYPPAGVARGLVPAEWYRVEYVLAGCDADPEATATLPARALDRARTRYASVLGSGFGASLDNALGAAWYGPAESWPSDARNAPWIGFWRGLDDAVGARLGPAGLADDFWGSFEGDDPSAPGAVTVTRQWSAPFSLASEDQRGVLRAGPLGDAGAVEIP